MKSPLLIAAAERLILHFASLDGPAVDVPLGRAVLCYRSLLAGHPATAAAHLAHLARLRDPGVEELRRHIEIEISGNTSRPAGDLCDPMCSPPSLHSVGCDTRYARECHEPINLLPAPSVGSDH